MKLTLEKPGCSNFGIVDYNGSGGGRRLLVNDFGWLCWNVPAAAYAKARNHRMGHRKKKRILDHAAGLGETVDSGHLYPPQSMKPEGHRHDDYTGWLKSNNLLALTDEEDRELEELAVFVVKTALTVKGGGPPVDREKVRDYVRKTLTQTERSEIKKLCKTFRDWWTAFEEEAKIYAKSTIQHN